MALTPGTRLGPYAITAQIGVGGMGEVKGRTAVYLDTARAWEQPSLGCVRAAQATEEGGRQP